MEFSEDRTLLILVILEQFSDGETLDIMIGKGQGGFKAQMCF